MISWPDSSMSIERPGSGEGERVPFILVNTSDGGDTARGSSPEGANKEFVRVKVNGGGLGQDQCLVCNRDRDVRRRPAKRHEVSQM